VIQYAALPVMMGIPVQLTQLFSNLVSNSLKFAKGAPRIEISSSPFESDVSADAADDEDRYINIRFRDHGIGFDTAYSEKVFILFQRLNHSRDYEGTGIGLALCKKIVENHAGKIIVQSEPGKGATFNLLFPVRKILVNA
ncbi:MAG TPA: ATP-binding protein, partial [Ohtaekwangia sp.]|nr:ATP-binding protein [Ohtaekwangia sp.]